MAPWQRWRNNWDLMWWRSRRWAQGVQGVEWWLDMVDTALGSSNCSVDSFFLMMYGAWCSILEFSEFCEVTGLWSRHRLLEVSRSTLTQGEGVSMLTLAQIIVRWEKQGQKLFFRLSQESLSGQKGKEKSYAKGEEKLGSKRSRDCMKLIILPNSITCC